MPIFSDALMDAGCDNEEIILHCRSGGPHGRGCWVVDCLPEKIGFLNEIDYNGDGIECPYSLMSIREPFICLLRESAERTR